MEFVNFLQEINIPEFFDIAFMSFLIYAVLILFKKTKARFVLTGLIIISVVYLLARQFNLVLTTSVLQAFFAVILIAVIVIFQEEIRHFFEQIAVWSLNPNRLRQESIGSSGEEIDILEKTVGDLASSRTGALVVIPGRNPVVRYLEGGIELNGKLSEPLLKSLFDPNSIGHDGAVIVEKGMVTQFSCHLPLSKNFQQLHNLGTRHAAALGLAEVTDALCLVVSEERGAVSVAREGELKQVGLEQLNLQLEKFYREMNPPDEEVPWHGFITANFKEKALAVVMALALWFVFVRESRLVYRSFEVPVKYTALPSELEVSEIDPENVRVTFLGPRRAFYFFNEKEIEVFLKIPDAKAGTKTVNISESNLSFPKEISLEDIEPRRVTVEIKQPEEEPEKG